MEDFSSNTQIHANTIRAVFIVLIVAVFPYFTSAQGNLSTSSKKATKLYYKADKKYKERDFETAIEYLEEAARIDTTFYEAHIRLGSLYNALGQADSVYSKFKTYIRLTSNPVASVLERMAHMAFDRGDYNLSAKYLKGFLSIVPEKSSDREIALLSKSLAFAEIQLDNPDTILIQQLSEAINQFKLQYLPAITVDNATMIYTKRDNFGSDEDIVISIKKNGEWQAAQPVSSKINTNLNEGACTISADGRTMIFTSCDRRNAFGSCDLFISKKIGDNWTRPKNLGKAVNTQYWESQPSLSADGNTLYFTSNRPGGYGGRDIWVTQSIDGKWKKPTNLGEKINSFKDETTPFIHFNGKTLYFSSNSYPGMGGFDLFECEKLDSIWSSPVNLGYPINTYRDEVSLLITADGDYGYFAKEQQKNREILDSKIVSFMMPDSLKPTKSSYLIGKVIDKADQKPLKASVEVYNIDTNERLYYNSSDSITGEYYMVLPANKSLAGYVKKAGYLYHDFRFNTNAESDTLMVELSRISKDQILVLENIYFDTDSYDLDDRSQSEISSVMEVLIENPGMVIEIRGHTDDIGARNYNKVLSENRALSVYKELIEKGISAKQLSYAGFGDSLPIVPNDSDINRQSNRRIEFRVIRL